MSSRGWRLELGWTVLGTPTFCSQADPASGPTGLAYGKAGGPVPRPSSSLSWAALGSTFLGPPSHGSAPELSAPQGSAERRKAIGLISRFPGRAHGSEGGSVLSS